MKMSQNSTLALLLERKVLAAQQRSGKDKVFTFICNNNFIVKGPYHPSALTMIKQLSDKLIGWGCTHLPYCHGVWKNNFLCFDNIGFSSRNGGKNSKYTEVTELFSALGEESPIVYNVLEQDNLVKISSLNTSKSLSSEEFRSIPQETYNRLISDYIKAFVAGVGDLNFSNVVYSRANKQVFLLDVFDTPDTKVSSVNENSDFFFFSKDPKAVDRRAYDKKKVLEEISFLEGRVRGKEVERLRLAQRILRDKSPKKEQKEVAAPKRVSPKKEEKKSNLPRTLSKKVVDEVKRKSVKQDGSVSLFPPLPVIESVGRGWGIGLGMQHPNNLSDPSEVPDLIDEKNIPVFASESKKDTPTEEDLRKLVDNFAEEYIAKIPWDEKDYRGRSTKDVRFAMENLSGNVGFTESFYEKHLDKINWLEICMNPSLGEAFYERHIKKVVWEKICGNIGLPESFFRKHLDKLTKSDWQVLVRNPRISEKFIEEFLERITSAYLPKNKQDIWEYICKNVGLSEAFFRKHLNKFINYKNATHSLSHNSSISAEFFEEFFDKFDINRLAYNKGLDEKIFIKNIAELEKSGRRFLCMNANFRESFFEEHADLKDPDTWIALCKNNNLSESFFRKHLDKFTKNKRAWESLSANTSISEEFFEEFIKKVEWHNLSANTSMSEKFFIRHIKKIKWEVIATNSALSPKFFRENFPFDENLFYEDEEDEVPYVIYLLENNFSIYRKKEERKRQVREANEHLQNYLVRGLPDIVSGYL